MSDTQTPIIKTHPNPSNEMRPPQMKDPAERKKLATTLCSWIENGCKQKGSLPDRWRKNEEIYRGQPDDTYGLRVTEDAEPQVYNIVKPRVDALTTKVCQPLTANRPFFSAIGSEEMRDDLKEAEDVVQFVYDNAKYQKKLRTITRHSCMAAPMYWKVPFVSETEDMLADSQGDALNMPRPYRYVGPALKIVHPNDMVIYPLITGNIERARMVGERYFMRLAELRELQRTGKYFDTDTIYGGDDPQSWESGRDSEWSKTEEAEGIENAEDEVVAYWEVIVKLDLDGDGFEERYRCVVADTIQELLECEYYGFKTDAGTLKPYSRIWYFPHWVEPPGYNEQFHANPPVQYLQTPQAAYSDLLTLTIEGVKMFALPAGFVKGGTLDHKVIRYQFGEVHFLPAGVEIEFLQPKMDIQHIPFLLDTIKKDADALLRISQNGTAQVQGDSATEAAILENNMEEGAEEYRDNVSQSGEEMADFIRELCYIHYDEMKSAYKETFPCEDPESLKNPLRWEASGKTSATNPQIVAQNFKDIWEVAQNPQIGPMLGINLKGIFKAWVKTKKLPIPDSDIFMPEGGIVGGNGEMAGGIDQLGVLVDQLSGPGVPQVPTGNDNGPVPGNGAYGEPDEGARANY